VGERLAGDNSAVCAGGGRDQVCLTFLRSAPAACHCCTTHPAQLTLVIICRCVRRRGDDSFSGPALQRCWRCASALSGCGFFAIQHGYTWRSLRFGVSCNAAAYSAGRIPAAAAATFADRFYRVSWLKAALHYLLLPQTWPPVRSRRHVALAEREGRWAGYYQRCSLSTRLDWFPSSTYVRYSLHHPSCHQVLFCSYMGRRDWRCRLCFYLLSKAELYRLDVAVQPIAGDL